MSLSINTTVPSAPSTEPTPLSNTLNDDEEVELMKVNSPTTTIRELHDRAAESGNVISLVSPEASPTPPLQNKGRNQGGGGGLLFGRDEGSNGAARTNTVEHRVLDAETTTTTGDRATVGEIGLTLQEYQQMLIDARILKEGGGGGGGLMMSLASTSAWDSSNGAARTNTVEHRVLTNKSKSKKLTSKSKRKKSKAKTEKGTKSAKSDKGTKSTKASKSDTSDKGTTSTKKSEALVGFTVVVVFPLLSCVLWGNSVDFSDFSYSDIFVAYGIFFSFLGFVILCLIQELRC